MPWMDFFEEQESENLRHTMFNTLFAQIPDKERSDILAKLVSIAVGLQNKQLLECAAVWMQVNYFQVLWKCNDDIVSCRSTKKLWMHEYSRPRLIRSKKGTKIFLLIQGEWDMDSMRFCVYVPREKVRNYELSGVDYHFHLHPSKCACYHKFACMKWKMSISVTRSCYILETRMQFHNFAYKKWKIDNKLSFTVTRAWYITETRMQFRRSNKHCKYCPEWLLHSCTRCDINIETFTSVICSLYLQLHNSCNCTLQSLW